MFHKQTRDRFTGFRLGGFILGIVMVSAWVASSGCTPLVSPEAPGTPSPTGEQLFKLITETDPYQQWAQFPDREGTLPSALPHGPMSRVFINSEVESALVNFTGQLPEGSIIVKENVGTDPQVTEAALTVMWKVTGFNSPNNDWFWANVTPDGEIVAEGKVSPCIVCHAQARANDFVFVHSF